MIALLPWFIVLIFSWVFLFEGNYLAIGSIILGYIVGLFVFAQMILPLIYGLPRSIWLYYRNQLRFMGIVSEFITPAIWFGLFFITGFVLEAIAPSIRANNLLFYDPHFNLGGLLAIFSLLLNLLTKKGREDMNVDYHKTTIMKYGK